MSGSSDLAIQNYSQNPALRTATYYRHVIITDSLLRPLEKKALTLSLNSARLIRRTPR